MSRRKLEPASMVPSRTSDRCSLAWLLTRDQWDRIRSASVLVIAGALAAGSGVAAVPVPVLAVDPCWPVPADGFAAGDRRIAPLRGITNAVMAATAAMATAAVTIRRTGNRRPWW